MGASWIISTQILAAYRCDMGEADAEIPGLSDSDDWGCDDTDTGSGMGKRETYCKACGEMVDQTDPCICDGSGPSSRARNRRAKRGIALANAEAVIPEPLVRGEPEPGLGEYDEPPWKR